ncbi:zinc metalloprotease [Persicitalea jodogahamensis]|nr:zinc metalloprotease [Persicitalea jodogahamensis]
MKPVYKALFVAASMTFVVACSESHLNDEAMQPQRNSSARIGQPGAEDRCATMRVLSDKLAENPGLARSMEAIEAHTQRFLSMQKGNSGNEKPGNGNGKPGNGGGGGTGGGGTTDPATTITIPVYVHVIYSTSQQNISNAQIQSQIDVLNKDFRAQNSDKNSTPSEFASLIADFNIQYSWNTNNLIRKASSKSSWGTNDAVKNSKRGGSNPVPGYLNIWVCNIGGGILGYAQFPGGSASTDGVVIGPEYFGSSALGSNFYLSAPYDLGRTATHEIGHWLNLRHIWGDGGCGVDDYVSDTPMSDGPNYGCPAYPTVRCNSSNMTMNYMDYTYDGCMYMFSTGQKERSRAIFAPGGPRADFVSVTP